MADAGSRPARSSSSKARLLGLAVFCAASALGLGTAGPTVAERERASEREGLDRSLDDPQVKRIRERWRDAPEPKADRHPPFSELEGVQREADDERGRQAAREAERSSPRGRERRARSRRAHADAGRGESVALARAEFPRLFSGADRRLLPLEAGERVLRYTGARTAVVDRPGEGASLVDSTFPLRAPDEGGALEAVDLDLQPSGEGWVPENPLVSMRFGERADRAVSVGEDFTVGFVGSQAAGTRTANEVFFAEVAPDTDGWFGPSATGARLGFQLRSELSPQELRLEVGGAPGLELRTVVGPGVDAPAVEFLRDGERVGAMTAPTATDADGQLLDVGLRVEGREIVVEVAHRDESVLYPVAVDPVYENQDSWKYGNPNNAGWRFQSNAPSLFSGGYTNWYAGSGFYVVRAENQWFHRSHFGEYAYYAPNDFSYISRADFMHVRQDGGQSNTTQGMWSRMWGGFQHSWTNSYPFDAAGSYWSVCAGGNVSRCNDWDANLDQSRGNYVQSSIWPNVADWAWLGGGALGYFGGARIWMSDWEPPGLWYFSPTPAGWVHDVPATQYAGTNQVHVRYGDRGLGMWQLWMDVPGWGREGSTDAGGCSGASSSRCPESRAHNFNLSYISQGVQTITATGQDVLNRTASASRTLRIDRSRPALPTGSGSLAARANEFIVPQTYSLGIQGSDSYSGVKGVSYRVVRQSTGAQVASGSASNPGCATAGCSATWKPASDFSVNASGWPAGKYTVELTVKDQLGDDPTHGAASHTTRSSFVVEMDRDPPSVAVAHEGLEPWLGDDREVRTTVTGTDSGAGVKSFLLDFAAGADETRARSCGGTGTTRCPTQASEAFTYRTNAQRFPDEGRHQLRATVADARGSATTSGPWQVGVDRTAPELALSGALYDRRGQELPDGSYQLDVLARDGDAGSDASARSGVRSLDILLNGESVEFSQQECPEGSCPLEASWAFDTSEHPGGQQVVEVVTEDHLGHQRKERFEFDGGPCCIGSSTVWGNALGKGPVLFGDVNGDARTDAFGRNVLSRHAEAALSNGSSFGAFEDWGALTEFRTLTDLALGDVNYDGLEDLVGRNASTGEVWAATSTGTAFDAPTVWGTWPSNRTLKVVDVDGDGSVDLAGRDQNDGRIYVSYSDDTAFEEPLAFTSYAVAAGDEWHLADVQSDFSADLIVRSGDTVSVGRYQDSTFEPLTSWGTLPANRTALFGDVDGDGAADMLGYDATAGTATLSASTETAFNEPRSFGEFPIGHRLTLIDGNANGQLDIVGEQVLLGDLRVALTDMVTAVGPPAQNWAPEPGIVYDNEDETLPTTDPEIDLDDPPLGALAAGSSERVPMRLGFQDERRLNRRFQIPDPTSTDPAQPYINEQDAYGERRAETDALLQQRVYAPLKAAGGDTDPSNPRPKHKPIMRIIVLWGQIENTPGTMVNGQPQRYYFDKLDHAIQRAESAGFHVYLTLSGTTDFECIRAYNPNMRACTSRATGIDPAPEQFGEFAAAVAGRYKGRATAYGIWNEPNNGTFLRAGPEGRHNPVQVLYRKLYLAAYNRIKRDSNPNDAFGYRDARVYIGELSHLTRSVRVSPTSKQRKSFSALRFLRDVVERHPDSDALVRTQGVAWHPYQHTGQPDRRGKNGVVGIGRANEIQELLDKLAERTGQNREGPRLLVTPKAKRPALFFTEFGYFNGPYAPGRPRKENPDCPRDNCGTQYYKTEAGRADYYRRALRRAYFQDARWMVIYQATEISPQNYADARNSSQPPPEKLVTPPQAYIPEYGLFAPDGEVTGTRGYGKGPNEDITLNSHTRQAYCTIYDWAAARDYGVGADPCEPAG